MEKLYVDKLKDKTEIGFQLKAFSHEDNDHQKLEELGAHRDDHYLFFLLTKGSGSVIVDFQEKIVNQGQLYYIMPDQIHYRIKTNQASGWFIGVDTSFINTECRYIFESWLGVQAALTLSPANLSDCNHLLTMLHKRIVKENESALNIRIYHALLNSFLTITADCFQGGIKHLYGNDVRAVKITMQFKKLLRQKFRECKKPSDFAKMLHISEPYLNESVKKVTGSSITFWIKEEILIEAKRLLYFTDLNIKQIAHNLGYENHSYFCRFFKKANNISALNFRKKFK